MIFFFLYQKKDEELFSMFRSQDEINHVIYYLDEKPSESKLFLDTYKSIKDEENEMLNVLKNSFEDTSDSLSKLIKGK